MTQNSLVKLFFIFFVLFNSFVFSQEINWMSLKDVTEAQKTNPKNVLIHDSARPLVSNKLIKKIIIKLNNNSNCIPYIIHNDYIKTK